MITPAYCQTMARYNMWQNDGLRGLIEGMDEAALQADRGAFFGSIMGTLNHLLWGDLLWISRFDGGAAPKGGIPQSPGLTADKTEWATLRFAADRRIKLWAGGLRQIELTEDLTWHSGALGREVTKPLAICIIHFFNHQTHHRGQIHAMLTAAGQKPQDTDVFVMPEGD